MNHHNPFTHLSLEKAIHLRWALRDIQAKRTRLTPVSEEDMALLTELGLVEVVEGVPALTDAGFETISERS